MKFQLDLRPFGSKSRINSLTADVGLVPNSGLEHFQRKFVQYPEEVPARYCRRQRRLVQWVAHFFLASAFEELM
jgi:hypothetical protein